MSGFSKAPFPPPSSSGRRRKKRDDLIGEQVISCPFPVPLNKQPADDHQNDECAGSEKRPVTVWPLNQSGGQPFFLGKINQSDACIDIMDAASVQCLYLSGFFGKGSRSKNAPIYKIKRKREMELRSQTHHKKQQNETQSSNNNNNKYLTRRSPVRTRNGPKKKQWQSLIKACGGSLPDKQSLVNKLYHQNQSQSDSSNNTDAVHEIESDTETSADSDASSSWTSEAADTLRDHSQSNNCEQKDRPEILKLGLEEAYFLSYGLGVLSVVSDQSADPFMDLDQMWSTYRRLFDPKDLMSFPVIYAAYHYFRSNGWIVKCGLKFGSDFLLYREGPPFNHSEFAVTVFRIHQSEFDPSDTSIKPELDWQHVSAMQRMTNGVRKKAILCHVIIGNDVSDQDFSLVSVIQKLHIHCSLIHRWTTRHNHNNHNNDGDEDSE
jgi:tRNA-intron lyase